MRLLLVDDDLALCLMLREFFRETGYSIDFEVEGTSGLARAEANLYNLLILDVMLPGLGGLEILQRVRKGSAVPILLLTAKSDRADRVRGLEMGADDYLVKPFFAEELLARVRAILRRSVVPEKKLSDALRIGELLLVPGDRDAQFQGKALGLTAMECEILEQLMRSYGRAVSRDTLSLHLYDRLTSPFDRSIDTHVSRIRRKLGEGRDMILSIRGTGYQLRRSGETADA